MALVAPRCSDLSVQHGPFEGLGPSRLSFRMPRYIYFAAAGCTVGASRWEMGGVFLKATSSEKPLLATATFKLFLDSAREWELSLS